MEGFLQCKERLYVKSEQFFGAYETDFPFNVWACFNELCAQPWQWPCACLSHSLAAVSWLLASRRVHRSEAFTGVNAATHHSFLFALPFAAMLALAAAINCDIDLSLNASSYDNPVFAQCDAACDSCNFTLAIGCFQWGTIECLENVHCQVTVSSDDNCNTGAMLGTTVNGSQASMLTVEETGNGLFTWQLAVFLAPANAGEFRFESCAQVSLVRTEFHAVGSGVVYILINEDGVEDSISWGPEFKTMFVYASTANELNIVLGENTRFARQINSYIECPQSGTCLWQSSGRRFYGSMLAVVSLKIYPSTTLQLLCANNAESCDGLYVNCSESDSCQMQYATDTWACVGQCEVSVSTLLYSTTLGPTSTYATAVAMSTTATKISTTTRLITSQMPATSSRFNATPVATDETTDDPQTGDGPQSGIPLLHVVIGAVLCLLVCCCAVALSYFFGQRQLLKSQMIERDTAQSEFEDAATDKRLIEAQPSAENVDKRFSDASLIADQPEGGQSTADGFDERPQSPQIEGWIKEAPRIDLEDSDEQMYIQMGPSTVGHTQG